MFYSNSFLFVSFCYIRSKKFKIEDFLLELIFFHIFHCGIKHEKIIFLKLFFFPFPNTFPVPNGA